MEHIELKQLVNMCVKGRIQIGRPIMLTSRDRTQTTNVSFLNHLLKYNGIKQDKLFTLYFKILQMFNRFFGDMMNKSTTFNRYVQHVKKEWNVDTHILYEYNTSLERSRKTIEQLLENMNILCRQFRELNMRVSTNNMTDVIVEDEMLDGMDRFLEKVRNISSEIDEFSSVIDSISEGIEGLNMGTIIDLSMKDKTMYLEFGGVCDDVNIPENINISFLNYVYILNLIKKHIVYYTRIISKVKDISDNMSRYVEDSKDTIQSKDNLFSLNKQQGEIDGYLDGLDSQSEAPMDDDMSVEDIEDDNSEDDNSEDDNSEDDNLEDDNLEDDN
jgi:hypothetical protein